jgi:hypothetical protein
LMRICGCLTRPIRLSAKLQGAHGPRHHRPVRDTEAGHRPPMSDWGHREGSRFDVYEPDDSVVHFARWRPFAQNAVSRSAVPAPAREADRVGRVSPRHERLSTVRPRVNSGGGVMKVEPPARAGISAGGSTRTPLYGRTLRKVQDSQTRSILKSGAPQRPGRSYYRRAVSLRRSIFIAPHG